MTAPFDARPASDRASVKKLLVRAVRAPAGLPWEQLKAADLEARMNAPLPLIDLDYQIKRLEPWAPNRQSLFAAVYGKRVDVREGFSERVVCDGHAFEVKFEKPGEAFQKRLGAFIGLGAAVLTSLSLALATGAAFTAKSDAETRLDRIDALISARTKRLAQLTEDEAIAKAVDNADLGNRTFGQVLKDLSWAVEAKKSDGHFLAWYWDRGLMAVEYRGETAPFPEGDRLIKRSPAPVAKGVYLFGIGEGGSAARQEPQSPMPSLSGRPHP